MDGNASKVIREGLIWPFLGVLLSAGFVAAVISVLLPRSNGAVYRKSVILEMTWERGDSHYGPNFIHLESACLSNSQPGCFCGLDFRTTTSKEFADYIKSFGSNRVPVKFSVDYDRNHGVVGAMLESVGEWPEGRLSSNEKSLGTGFRMLPGQHTSGGHLNNPADCFPLLSK
jgi:hypothetical protein